MTDLEALVEAAVDEAHEASSSVVRRYRSAVRLSPDHDEDEHRRDLLMKVSDQEGLQIRPLGMHRGVTIDLLDETSLMRTGSMKSIDGCVTIAHCLARGVQGIVFESGGNTGTALTTYGTAAGLETFLFLPVDNVDLLDSRTFDHPLAHVFAVASPADVKPAAEQFAADRGLPRVPELEWRIQASTFVGWFVLEHLLAGHRYDVLAQSISAGFGPIGIYGVLRRVREALPGCVPLPAFLGVQQAANAPMYDALGAGGRGAGANRSLPSTDRLLARVMYDSEPRTYGTVEPLGRLLVETSGRIATLDVEQFDRAAATVVAGEPLIDRLATLGIHIARRPDGSIVERTGLMALARTLLDIEGGQLAPGSRVLVCLTGGTAKPDGSVRPTVWDGGA